MNDHYDDITVKEEDTQFDEEELICWENTRDIARPTSPISSVKDEEGSRTENRQYTSSQFICNFCHKTFRSASYLQVHLRFHTGERPYSCEFCGKSFTTSSHLRRHEGNVHRNRPIFTDQNEEFNNDGVVLHQSSPDLGMNVLHCPKCDIVCSSPLELQLHTKAIHLKTMLSQPFNHSDTQELSSTSNIKSFDNFVSQQYRSIDHQSDQTVSNCSFSKQLRSEWKNQQEMNLNKSPSSSSNLIKRLRDQFHPCLYCDSVFSTSKHLVQHIFTKHCLQKDTFDKPNEPKYKSSDSSVVSSRFKSHFMKYSRFVCRYCQKSFSSKAVLNIHMRFHTGYRPFKCKLCSKSFTISSHYKRHYVSAHSKFIPEDSISNHLRLNEEVKREPFQDCDPILPQMNTSSESIEILDTLVNPPSGQNDISLSLDLEPVEPLNYPSCIPTTEKTDTILPCEQCSQQHENSENGEDRTCQFCGKVFICPNYLKVHIRFHTGERPYPCSVCLKSYATASNRSRHEANVHSFFRRISTSDKYQNKYQLDHESPLPSTVSKETETISPLDLSASLDSLNNDKMYSESSSMNLHFPQSKVESKNEFRCTMCPRMFIRAKFLETHLFQHKYGKTFQCPVCMSEYPSKEHLKFHIQLDHSDEIYFNDHVKLPDFNEQSEIDVNLFDNSPDQSTYSPDVINDSVLLNSPLLNASFSETDLSHEQHNNESLNLPIFDNSRPFFKNPNAKPVSKQKTFTCSVCSSTFSTRKELNCHVEFQHNSYIEYPSSMYSDYGHTSGQPSRVDGIVMQNESSQPNILVYPQDSEMSKCIYCGKMFTASYMKVHHRFHTGERPYSCTQCDKAFTVVSHLHRHYRTVHKVGQLTSYPDDII